MNIEIFARQSHGVCKYINNLNIDLHTRTIVELCCRCMMG